MRNFQRKNTWRNILESKPVLALLGILILYFAWNLWGFWNKMEETAKNKKLVEDRITELQKQETQLSADIKTLNTDAGKEKVFRENYGLAKEGEGVIVVVDDQNPPPAPKPASTGFWGFIKNLFK